MFQIKNHSFESSKAQSGLLKSIAGKSLKLNFKSCFIFSLKKWANKYVQDFLGTFESSGNIKRN